ncbi:MAG TPA: PaaI family thioesterase [Firmicutes bacterium]|nr:PaaI family thioesterase [Bacillota bacterium]
MRVKDYSGCFACGLDNPRSLGLEFVAGAGGSVTATWTGAEWYQGYPGMVHGGIICTLLDEAMAKAVQELGAAGVTGKMEVWFRRPTPTGVELTISGWIEERRGRRIKAGAEIRDRQGRLLAEGRALFIVRDKG